MADDRGRRFVRALQAYVARSVAPVRAFAEQLQLEMRAYPTMSHVQALVRDEFAKVSTIRGEDGKSVTFDDVKPFLEAWMAKCETEAERRAQARVDEAIALLQKRMLEIPSSDALTARFDAQMARLEMEADRRAQERIEKALDSIRQPADGKDGASVEDFDIAIAGRVLTVAMSIGGDVQRRTVKLPLPHDAGVYRSGQAYEEGAIVTFGGSAFIAQRDAAPTDRPEASTAWRLLVKRGRDGKDAE